MKNERIKKKTIPIKIVKKKNIICFNSYEIKDIV